MRVLVFLILFGGLVSAQQLIVPDELKGKQRKVFEKITQAISAPCCDNGVPVAYHESGMSNYLRDLVARALLDGKSENEIMAELAEMRLGDQQKPIIFTVPENNLLGWAVWVFPVVFIALGAVLIMKFVKSTKREPASVQNQQELADKYREAILNKIERDIAAS